MYIKRTLEEQIESAARFYPVVVLTGARQVGKTTLLQEYARRSGINIEVVTLDDPLERAMAKTDPELFLQRHKAPVIIDEVQYAPELFVYLKIIVDRDHSPGRYFLTGSQMFYLMKDVSESLAGRAAILDVFSLSRAEIGGYESKPFLPGGEKTVHQSEDVLSVFDKIYRGSMPQPTANPEMVPERFYRSYLSTYLERDVRDQVRIKDESKFIRFMGCLAARTAQERNLADIASDVEISQTTADEWISVLMTSGLVVTLPSYHKNTRKRLVKRPKLYFMDTGLACYLAGWADAKTLEKSAAAGAFFETYVVSEIIKGYSNAGIDHRLRMSFYRDSNGKEIDLIIQQNGMLYPIEIKKSANPGRNAVKNFTALQDLGENVGEGAVICMAQKSYPLDEKNELVPIGAI